jgi:hypothetical protein
MFLSPGEGAISVDPSVPNSAMRTMISAPCSTVWVPVMPLRSVLVKPGSTALIRMFGNAFANCTVIMLTAVFDAG